MSHSAVSKYSKSITWEGWYRDWLIWSLFSLKSMKMSFLHQIIFLREREKKKNYSVWPWQISRSCALSQFIGMHVTQSRGEKKNLIDHLIGTHAKKLWSCMTWISIWALYKQIHFANFLTCVLYLHMYIEFGNLYRMFLVDFHLPNWSLWSENLLQPIAIRTCFM